MNSFLCEIEKFESGSEAYEEKFYSTGFTELDKALNGGFTAGFHALGAISSLGKTTFALQMSENLAVQGIPVIIFSLEMRQEHLVAKAISRNMYLSFLEQSYSDVSDVNYPKSYGELMNPLIRKHLTVAEQNLLQKAIERTKKCTNGIDLVSNNATVPLTIDGILEYIENYINKTNKRPFIIIDYLQFIRPSERVVNRSDKQNMDYIVSSLVSCAQRFRIPILAISSLSRAAYDRPIDLAAFKESGMIEYSADIVLGMQLKGVGESGFDVNEAKLKTPREIEVVILKGRASAAGSKIEYRFNSKYNYFEEIKTPCFKSSVIDLERRSR